MKSKATYTHQRMGLDKNIWTVMILTIVVCIGLLSYKAAFHKDCKDFTIGVKNMSSGDPQKIFVGETLSLTTSEGPGSNVTWDFGDKTSAKDGSLVMHSFAVEGNYPVTARINGRCEQIQMVSVHKPQASQEATADAGTPVISIIGKEDPEVGEQVNFSSNTPASVYEWTIQDRKDYDIKKGLNVSYSFRTPGRYVLKLKLDNDPNKVSTKYIMVIPPSSNALLPTKKLIPPPPRFQPTEEAKVEDKPVEKPVEKAPEVKTPVVETPVAKKVKFIPDEPFADYLREVVEGSKDLAFFNKYLNNGGETLVQVKGEDKMIKFSELYQRIHNKKVTIKEVNIDRDANGDVLKINITYKKKGLLPF